MRSASSLLLSSLELSDTQELRAGCFRGNTSSLHSLEHPALLGGMSPLTGPFTLEFSEWEGVRPTTAAVEASVISIRAL